VLPAAADQALDRLARLTAAALGTPAALVSMVSRTEQVLPGAVGLPDHWQAQRMTPVSMSLCRHVVATGRAMSVDDVRAEPAMSDPAVTTELGVVAWAGAPIRALAAGQESAPTTAEVIGVVCALDHAPRAWAPQDLAVLGDLAAAVAGELRLRTLEEAAQRDLADARVSQRAAEAGRTQAQGSQLQAETATHLAQTVQRQTQAALVRAEAAERRAGVLLALSEALSDVRTAAELGAAVHQVATTHLGIAHTGVLVPTGSPAFAGHEGRGAGTGAEQAEQAATSPGAGVRDEPGWLRHVSMDTLPPGTDPAWEVMALAGGSPAAVAARTRQVVVLDSVQALRADYPHLEGGSDASAADAQGSQLGQVGQGSQMGQGSQVGQGGQGTRGEQREAGRPLPVMGASAFLPLVSLGQVTGVLVLVWDGPHQGDSAEQAVWEALGRYCAQALARVQVSAQLRSGAEVLQRSLLTRLPEPDHLEVRARYIPAAVGDEVGGDWYDALVLPDGATALVIGDVVGHDIAAAALMGQMRGALRAYAWDRGEPPSDVVRRLDASMAGLGIESMATLVMGRIEPVSQEAAGGADDASYVEPGARRLRWTNAGHPPPVLLLADGGTQVLQAEGADLLVGLDPGAQRCDQEAVLPVGSTLLLYTDGLIERRGVDLDDGLDRLRQVLSSLVAVPLPELLDAVVAELVGDAPADDCALLAVRAHREDRPRPAQAGLSDDPAVAAAQVVGPR